MLGFNFFPLNILVHFQDLFPVLAFQPIWFWNELEHNLASNVMAFKCFSSLHYISSKSLNSTFTTHHMNMIQYSTPSVIAKINVLQLFWEICFKPWLLSANPRKIALIDWFRIKTFSDFWLRIEDKNLIKVLSIDKSFDDNVLFHLFRSHLLAPWQLILFIQALEEKTVGWQMPQRSFEDLEDFVHKITFNFTSMSLSSVGYWDIGPLAEDPPALLSACCTYLCNQLCTHWCNQGPDCPPHCAIISQTIAR